MLFFSVPEFDFNEEDYEWSYDFQTSSTPHSEPDGLRALQGVEEINWRLTPVMRSNLTALITFDEFKKLGEKDTKREQEALNQAALVQCQIGKNMEDSTKKD